MWVASRAALCAVLSALVVGCDWNAAASSCRSTAVDYAPGTPGEKTARAALDAFMTDFKKAPQQGWIADSTVADEGVRAFTSGDWTVRISRLDAGGWVYDTVLCAGR